MLTIDRLKEFLRYDPLTGAFSWIKSPTRSVYPGDMAGTIHHTGYVYITLDGETHSAQRLAFLYMTGEWPKVEADHRNRVRGDNRWSNLRDATKAQQAQNRNRRSDNSSGHTGVHFNKRVQRWASRICAYGKRRHLGYFDTAEGAAAAYQAAKKELHN